MVNLEVKVINIMIGIISGLLSMLGWGIADFLMAKCSRKIGAIMTLLYSQIFGVYIASIYFFFNFSEFDINNISKFLPLLLLVGLSFTIADLAFLEGFRKGQVSLVSPIGGSFVWIIVVLSIIFFNEILKANQIIGIILIIFGIPLLSINAKEFLKIKRLNTFSGTREGLISMLGWGLALFLIIPASRNLGWFIPAFIARLFIVLFLVIYIISSKQSFRINFKPSVSVALFLSGLLYIIALFAYSFGVEGEYASIVAPIAASFPLVTVVLARIFLKERLGSNQTLGIVVVIIGLILISFQ